MKRLLSIMLILPILAQLTACGIYGEEHMNGALHLKNFIDSTEAEINIGGAEPVMNDDTLLMFKSDLSVAETAEMLEKNNPKYSVEQFDEHQIILKSESDCPYTLVSNRVYDSDANPIENIYIVTSESCFANQPMQQMKICFPIHLCETVYTRSGDDVTFSVSSNLHDPFFNTTRLKSSPNVFDDLVEFYTNCGCDVQHEGGNLTGGIIYVTPNTEGAGMFRILVMKSGDSYAMKYSTPPSETSAKAKRVITRYFNALQFKEKESFKLLFDKVDEQAAESFVDSVKYCELDNAEAFWADEDNGEYIFKVSFDLISEDGMTMGSYGTGTLNLVEYWNVNLIDGESKICGKYYSFSDCMNNLTEYKEFADNEENNDLVDWLFSLDN